MRPQKTINLFSLFLMTLMSQAQDKDSPNNFNYVVPDDEPAQTPYIIQLLPALPYVWPNVIVKGVLARSGFEVGIAWKMEQATIHALKGGDFRICSNNALSKVTFLDKGETMI
ncbi:MULTISPECIES: glycoside hydrolase family 95-like protein [unclassified Saccharicrinis]|uniref:glycoside hydrolase family 95-like protein n=1 Tax=unclassified Saccharicrinis TaxID=2646859 RepID=UPI003D346F11